MMKMVVFFLTVFIMTALVYTTSFAQDNIIVMRVNENLSLINSEKKLVDTMGVIVPCRDDSGTMIPLRHVMEGMGAQIEWHEAENSILIKKDALNIEVALNDGSIQVNNQEINSNTNIELIAGRVFLDVAVIGEMLGVKYSVDEDGFIFLGNVSDDTELIKGRYNEQLAEMNGEVGTLILEDDFTEGSVENWVVETDGVGDETVVTFENGVMDAQSLRGLTIWNKQKLEGNIRIEYDAQAVTQGGINDRLTDLNCFWNANEPSSEDFFDNSDERGTFSSYNTMKLYYVGYGGNNNTTTRFRKYDAERGGILAEYSTAPYLLEENTNYHIVLEVVNGYVKYYSNDRLLFIYYDENVLTDGHFGVRTAVSHIQISNLKIYSI